MKGLRAALSWWERQSGTVQDIVVAGAVTVLATMPMLSSLGTQLGDLPRRPADALSVGLVLAQTLPLALRRRQPALCLAVVGTAFAVYQAVSYPTTFASAGLYLALYSVGAYQVVHRRTVAALASAAYAVLAVVLRQLGSPQPPLDFGVFYLSLPVAWLAGTVVRRWRVQEAERHRLAAQMATSTEQARIARELHDVVTHHVTAMVVQADAAQFLLASAPDRTAEGLTAIAGTGRRALTDLRHLLGVLEATGESSPVDPRAVDRAPTLGRLQDLVEGARLSGQPVEFTEHGQRHTRAVDVELAAYRVVQEALTNAMKYAPGQPTAVVVRHAAEHIEIEVVTASSSTSAPGDRSLAGGRGVAGLRHRVGMLGGELTAGPRPDGAFVLRAMIPAEQG